MSTGVTEQQTCDKITVIARGRFAQQCETVTSRSEFVLLDTFSNHFFAMLWPIVIHISIFIKIHPYLDIS